MFLWMSTTAVNKFFRPKRFEGWKELAGTGNEDISTLDDDDEN